MEGHTSGTMFDPTEIGKRLALARGLGGLSARGLCELTDLSRPYLSALERGQYASPGVDKIGRIASALGVDLAWVISGTGTAPTQDVVKAAVGAARERLAAKHVPTPCPHCGADTSSPTRAA